MMTLPRHYKRRLKYMQAGFFKKNSIERSAAATAAAATAAAAADDVSQ